MQAKLTAIVENMIFYDYMLFGGSFLLFIFLIVIALLARKRMGISVTLITLAFLQILLAPTLGYKEMHKHLYKNQTVITKENKLQFSKAIIVEGELSNLSQYDFKSCTITAEVYKTSQNQIKNAIYSLRSFDRASVVEESIAIGGKRAFRIIIEPFLYEGSYKITTGAECI